MTALCILLAIGPASRAWAEEITVSELIQSGRQHQGEEVTLKGEVIGDYGFRGDGGMWTQLNGDAYAARPILEGGSPSGANSGIGVRMPADLARGLDPPGRYRTRGPLVRVTGVWKFHDPSRQEESYLEVESLTVIEPGRPLGEGPNWIVIVAGVLLLFLAAAVWVTRSEE